MAVIVNPFMGRGGASGASIPLQLRQVASGASGIAPQVTARGRQLQTAAPTIPRNSFAQGAAAFNKLADDVVAQGKISRQKANRRAVVEGLMSMENADQADAFNVSALGDNEMFGDDEPNIPTFSETTAATPSAKVNPLQELGMGKKAQDAFKRYAENGMYDEAFSLYDTFVKAKKDRVILSEGQAAYEVGADGNLTEKAQRPKTFAPVKPDAPKVFYDRSTGKNRAVTSAELSANPSRYTTAIKSTDLFDPDGKPIQERIDIQQKLAKAGVAQPENIFKKEIAEVFAKEFGTAREQARDARTRLDNFAEASKMLDKIESLGGQTGIGSALFLEAKKLGNRLFDAGFDPELIATEEAFAAKTGQLAMDYISQTKGAISDREMDRFDKMSPNLTTSLEGNRHLIKYAQIRARLILDTQRAMNKYMKENNGVLDAGFDDELAKSTQGVKDEIDRWYVEASDIARTSNLFEETGGGLQSSNNNSGGINVPRNFSIRIE
tara:strand:+ start:2894 stop:4378 length:1485 start_codon:yes stop_codon:yes gene_type:complete